MKRLVFLVEGDTEIIFIEKHVMPFLYKKGFANPMNVQKIITNRKLHKKGGNINYDYLKNDIERVWAQGNVIITTFLDFFRLPPSFPGYTTDRNRIAAVEKAVWEDLGGRELVIPYIQLHEMEALMFAGMDGFDIVVDEAEQLAALQMILDSYPNPEDINSTPQGAPSKRLENIFNYDKIADGELILEGLGLNAIIQKCPRFATWLKTIEDILQKHV